MPGVVQFSTVSSLKHIQLTFGSSHYDYQYCFPFKTWIYDFVRKRYIIPKFICEKVMFFIRSLKLPSWMTFSYNSDGSSKFRLSFALTFWNDFQRNFPISYLSWSLGINKYSLGLVFVGTSRLLGRSPEDVTTPWLKKFSYMVRNWNHWGSCRSFLLNSS